MPPFWTGEVETSILKELPAAVSVRAVPAGGTTFRVLETGSGHPLVLLHGRGLAATSWAPWIAPLAARYRVIVPDLPGFGATAPGPLRPGGAEEGLSYFVEPIVALLGALGAQNPVLVGHSLGGFVALEMSLRRSTSPAALVLIGSMGLGPEMSYAARAYFRLSPERLAKVLPERLFSRLSPLPDHLWGRRLAALEYELLRAPSGRRVPAEAFNRLYSMVGPALHRRSRLAEVEAPTLLLWGENDAAFPSPMALVAAAALPRGQAKIFRGLGHSPQMEDPEGTLRFVEAFLRKAAAVT